MNNDQIMVSICCVTYNHEKYITETLEGFVSQKTNFPFEVLIHDDASTDKTADIIKEYEKRYPSIIKPIYQVENQYSKNVKIQKTYNYPRVKGKYIAFCEGDDYWCNPNKLQMMVNSLEKHADCSICHHAVNIIKENGEYTGDYFPRYKSIKDGVIPSKEYLSLILYTKTLYLLQFQLSGVMVRTEILNRFIKNRPEYTLKSDVGDITLFLYMGLVGNAFYISERMSSYRSGSIGSWNSRNCGTIDKKVRHLEIEINMLDSYDEYSNKIVHEAVVDGINCRKFAIYRARHDFKGMISLKKFFNLLTFKAKIKELLLCYFPFTRRILR